VNLDRRLVVHHGRKRLTVAERDGRVALDNLVEEAAARLKSQREREHVEQDDVFHVARQHAALDGRAHRDHLVGVNFSRGVFAEYLADGARDDGRARLAADEQHLVHVLRLELGVPQSLLARLDRALDEVGDERLEGLAR
jgi:hypothetical protein